MKNTLAFRWLRRSIVLLFAAIASWTNADVNVPAGSTFALAGGDLDLACTDLTVAGTLSLGAGRVLNARHVNIAPGGLLQGDSGSITLAGDWLNAGSFQAGTSRVTITDVAGCTTSSTVTGNSTFYVLAMSSNAGRVINFAPGSVQSVTRQILIAGALGSPIILQSSSASNLASINLSGFQDISNVGVRNVSATGEWLAAGLINALGSGLAPRWFGSGPVIPTMPPIAMFAMMLLFVWVARRQLRNGLRKDSSL